MLVQYNSYIQLFPRMFIYLFIYLLMQSFENFSKMKTVTKHQHRNLIP